MIANIEEMRLKRIELSPGWLRIGVGQGIFDKYVRRLKRSILSVAKLLLKVLNRKRPTTPLIDAGGGPRPARG